MGGRQTEAGIKRGARSAAARRSADLPARARGLLPDLTTAHAQGDLRAAAATWLMLSLLAPAHPETLRWSARLALADGQVDRALETLQRALVATRDPDLLRLLAEALDLRGEHSAALQALRQAADCTTHPGDWLELGIAFDRLGESHDALAAADRALALQPELSAASLLRVRCLQALGRAPEGAAECRRLIRHGREPARAWFSLLELKTETIDVSELAALERAERQHGGTLEERTLLGFALGRAYEATGLLEKAFATLVRANQALRPTLAWNARRFSSEAEAVRAAFGGRVDAPAEGEGSEVIFLVGLPRSGSTLFEQVLAAHPSVEGASELPYLEQVIERESRRRQRPFAQWAAAASARDWARLGGEYLQLSARWRSQRSRATDKLPSNWLLAGAALAMLPGARIIDCRRDPLETCWSCFKQLFAPGKADFSYDFDDLAAYWRDYTGLADAWSRRNPQQFRTFRYEDLIDDPERRVRELLEFCGLPFDPRCLRPHEAQRSIRTASAAQVRQPIQRDTARGNRYGTLLDPLRRSLEAVGAGSG